MGIEDGEPLTSSLEVLAAYAQDDVEKIHKLPVTGYWTTAPEDDLHKMLIEALIESLKLFTSLKELVVYHTDVRWEDFLITTEEGEDKENSRTVVVVERSKKRCWTRW
jgi:hypothetical protein